MSEKSKFPFTIHVSDRIPDDTIIMFKRPKVKVSFKQEGDKLVMVGTFTEPLEFVAARFKRELDKEGKQ